jgi:hypothetical protein
MAPPVAAGQLQQSGTDLMTMARQFFAAAFWVSSWRMMFLPEKAGIRIYTMLAANHQYSRLNAEALNTATTSLPG